MASLRRKEAILTRRASAAALARAKQEHALYELMVGEGFKPGDSSVKLDGVSFTPASTTFAVVQDKAKVIEYLRERDSGLIEERIMQGELNRLVREKLDNGEPLPPGLGYHDKLRVTTKGATKSTKEDADGEG